MLCDDNRADFARWMAGRGYGLVRFDKIGDVRVKCTLGKNKTPHDAGIVI